MKEPERTEPSTGTPARSSPLRSLFAWLALLRNVYHAFDFRGEDKIHDVLDASVEGDFLSQIYLETRKGLELASQGGARAKVAEIHLVEVIPGPGEDGGFTAEATWEVDAKVGHWGHVHQRRNRYRAQLDVRVIEGHWKLVEVEILEEERL